MTEFAVTIIDRLYQVGVLLAGVRNRLGPGEEDSRLASAMSELDLIGRGIRTWAFEGHSPKSV